MLRIQQLLMMIEAHKFSSNFRTNFFLPTFRYISPAKIASGVADLN